MFNPGEPFPLIILPSSKGGTVAIRDVLAKGPTIVGVIPAENQNTWLEAAERMTYHWLMEKFVSVYLVVNLSPEQARAAADEHGIQASLLCDQMGSLLPKAAGFYFVQEGIITARVRLEEGPAALAKLVS